MTSIEIRDTDHNVLFVSADAKNIRDAVSEAVAQDVDLAGANLGAKYRKGQMASIVVTAHMELAGAKLHGARLRDAKLDAAHFAHADLSSADLRSATIRYTDLRNADLRRANLDAGYAYRAVLSGADLRGASLRGTTLSGANLEGADLRDADLRDADLRGAKLRGATLDNALTAGAKLNSLSEWEGASLVGTTITPATLTWHRFRGAITLLVVLVLGVFFWAAVIAPFI